MQISPRQAATICAALQSWKNEAALPGTAVEATSYLQSHAVLTSIELDRLIKELDVHAQSVRTRRFNPNQGPRPSPCWKVSGTVPTYMPTDAQPTRHAKSEFDSPWVPVTIDYVDGVRLLLGDLENHSGPDIQAERRRNGWMLFIHSSPGDLVALLGLLDDGRSFLVREYATELPIQIMHEVPRSIDEDDLTPQEKQ